jgi:hypothetical protein
MDPRLAALILQLMQSDSDLSGVTNTAKNPLMMYLAGAYDPSLNLGARGGELFSQYAGNPEYPAVNKIINLIEQDADKFQVKTAATKMGVGMDTDIFDSATFESLADSLYDEYNKNKPGGENDFWGKAGLARPEDIYSSENMPSSPQFNSQLMEMQQRVQGVESEAAKARARADESKRALGPTFGKNIKTGGLIDFLKNDPEGYAMAKKAGVSPGFITPSGRTNKQLTVRELVGSKAGNMSTKQMIDFLKNNEEGKKILKQRGIRSDAIAKNGTIRYAKANVSDLFNDDTRAQSKPRQRDEYYARDFAAKQLEDEAKMQKYEQEQFARGYLEKVQKQGRTPLNDQLTQMASFLSLPKPKSK